RRRKPDLQWAVSGGPSKPQFLGVQVIADFPLTAIVPFIDWSPLFHTWELKGTHPRILEDKIVGEKAKELFEDAWRLLEGIVSDRSLRAKGVYGFWPANSAGDDIEVYADDGRS